HVDHNNNNNSQIQMGKKKELTAEQYGAILYGHKRGDSYQKIADNVQCGKTTVHDAIKRFKKMGSAIPKKHCGPKPLFDSNAQASLKKIVTQNSKHRRLTTHKIQELWIKKKKKKVSTVTIRRTLKKVGQTYAKVLQKHAIPSLYKLVPRNQGIFQEDNAPPHRSKIATNVRNASNIP
ncbi:11440_t:CDS:2, partial [Entrophospora sp. SA101]